MCHFWFWSVEGISVPDFLILNAEPFLTQCKYISEYSNKPFVIFTELHYGARMLLLFRHLRNLERQEPTGGTETVQYLDSVYSCIVL